MHLTSLDIYSRQGTGRTIKLTSPTTNATRLINRRDFYASHIRDHTDGPGRTMASTGAATDALAVG